MICWLQYMRVVGGEEEEVEEGWGGRRVDEGTQVHVCKKKIHDTEKLFKIERGESGEGGDNGDKKRKKGRWWENGKKSRETKRGGRRG